MEQWLTELFTGHGPHILHVATFFMLILCGMGLPAPEELIFLVAGYACHHVGGSVWVLCIWGVAGILAGDTLPFLIGRRYGQDFLKHRWFARLMSPKNEERTRQFFRTHGSKTVFIARFVAGLRMPAFFMAGTMGVRYRTFVFWDMLGALISCPTSIWLAYEFGPAAKKYLEESKIFVFIALGLAVLYIIAHCCWSNRNRTTPPPPAPPPPGTPCANSPVTAVSIESTRPSPAAAEPVSTQK